MTRTNETFSTNTIPGASPSVAPVQEMFEKRSILPVQRGMKPSNEMSRRGSSYILKYIHIQVTEIKECIGSLHYSWKSLVLNEICIIK